MKKSRLLKDLVIFEGFKTNEVGERVSIFNVKLKCVVQENFTKKTNQIGDNETVRLLIIAEVNKENSLLNYLSGERHNNYTLKPVIIGGKKVRRKPEEVVYINFLDSKIRNLSLCEIGAGAKT